jgi:hypothetical protein
MRVTPRATVTAWSPNFKKYLAIASLDNKARAE